jgi:DNA-binding NarL/FixJ family response regulator
MLEAARNADLLILDGEIDSINLLNSLGKSRPKGSPPYVLVLTKHSEEQHAVQMLRAGADGYMYRSDPPETVLNAIRRIAKGSKYVPNDIAEALVFAMNRPPTPKRLSHREYEVLHLFASGMRMTEIAQQLSLSVKTVSTYRSRLLDKLNLKTNVQLMRYAFKSGMVA